MSDAATEQPTTGGTQARWLTFFFLVAVGSFLLTDLLARNRSLERWEMAQSSQLSVRNGKLFSNMGNFTDYEERILLDEIPNADFSKGGLYFFGTSNVKWAFTTWDLPQGLGSRLHIYGIGGATHLTVLRFVRFLLERGAIPPEKSQVVIGASFHLGARYQDANAYFPSVLQRQGLYEIRDQGRLAEVKVGPVDRWWRIEKARTSGLIQNMARLTLNWAQAELGLSRQPPHDSAAYEDGWRQYMGTGDWRAGMDQEMVYLRETIAILKANRVPVKIILLPQGSWMNAMPYGGLYTSKVRAVCRETSTPLVDWSQTLPNSDFIDSNHLTVAGQTKFRKMILRDEASVLNGRYH